MVRTSTKDRYEVETEESERLIHPAPKLKPPRHDKRRETMDPDRDPDIDDDPDIAHDKDLSLNYKNVGGSALVQRVAGRYLLPGLMQRLADIDRSPPEKSGGGSDEYVAVVNKETGEPTHVKKDTLKGPEGAKYKIVEEEEGGEGEEESAAKPAGKKFPPEAVAQIQELAQSSGHLESMLRTLANPKHKEYETFKAIPQVPLTAVPQLKGLKLPEGVKTVGDLMGLAQQLPKVKKKKPGEAKPAPKETPAPPSKEEAKPPSTTEKPEAEKPSEEKKPEEAEKQPAPEKAPEKKPGAPKPGKPKGYDPEDYDYGSSHEDRAALESWVEEGGPKRKDFKEWAAKDKTVVEKDGELLFPSRGKKRVPFDQLSTSEQQKFKLRFESGVKEEKNLAALKSLAKDPEHRKLLRELGNPASELRQRVDQEARGERRDLGESDIGKTLPEVAGLKLPDTITSVQDLFDAAEKGYGPPPEPERSKPNKQEKLRAEQAVKDTFPEDIAEEISSMGLHPDDVSDLVSSYKAARHGPTGHRDVASLAKTMAGAGYSLDPETIDVPEKDENGKRFEDLDPKVQAKVYAKHKMALLATSLAAREKVTDALKETGLPERVSKKLSHAMLSAGGKDVSDDEVRNFYKDALATAFFHKPLSDGQIKQLFKTMGDNPAAKKFAVAYLQAKDYSDARKKYMDKDPENPDAQISEWDDPKTFARKLTGASDFLKDRSSRYPKDAVVEDTGMEFRNRVIDRLGSLSPESLPIVRGLLEDYEMDSYKTKAKSFEKDFKSYSETAEKEKKVLQKERAKAEGPGTPYTRPGHDDEADDDEIEARLARRGVHRPRRPTPPPGYEYWSDRPKVEGRGAKSWKWFKDLFKSKKKASVADQLLTHRVALRYANSSYPGRRSMGQISPEVRTAVYWGQQPYEQTEPYAGWTQLHARDFDQADFDGILGAAKDWLKMPVLGREIKGMVRDTQLRAALDLALRDHLQGKYSVGLYPTVYNALLAKLAGEGGPYELLTGKPDAVPGEPGTTTAAHNTQTREPAGRVSESTYGLPRERITTTMKASVHARSFATRAAQADRDPELAFDLLAFADHLAAEEQGQGQGQGQEQAAPAQQAEQQKQAAVRIAAESVSKFNALRSLVIRTAAEHPEARGAFIPLLQALKG